MLIAVLLIRLLLPGLSAQPPLPADSIPLELRTGARAVIRSAQIKVRILDEQRSRMDVKMIITLLNDKAENFLILEIPYDDLRRISRIKATAYNESGKLIWLLPRHRISDVRNFTGPEIFNDTRKKVIEFPVFNYPMTIAYTYRVSMRDLFLNPAFPLQYEQGVSVEESGVQFVYPEELKLHYKVLNLRSPIDSIRSGKKIGLSWKEENLVAVGQPSDIAAYRQQMPMVLAAPHTFELEGYQGSFHDWKEFGRWMNLLLQDRDNLDEPYRNQAEQLVDGLSSRLEKIRTLYAFMQQHTHYFYIGFGLGGYQPMPADAVARNGYGDCKALVNYMKALLKAAGIESYYTLVKSGEGQEIQQDFPGNQFDHAILCVPDGKDTVWLECTDPKAPFNYQGSFTGDRAVLVVLPEGGKLVRTPAYTSEMNRIETHSEVALNRTGEAEVHLKIRHSGIPYEELNRVSESRPDVRKLWLAGQLNRTAFDLMQETYVTDRNGEIPCTAADYTLHIRNFANTSRDMLFVRPSLTSKQTFPSRQPDEIIRLLAYRQTDTVIVAIPAGYAVTHLPGNKDILTRFGSYTIRFMLCEKGICMVRDQILEKGEYPREYHAEYYRFASEIASADQEMIVLTSSGP
jgi:transglutaminase-like putative cysteine protease